MQLVWLEAFVAVVETGSIVRAGLRLGRAQSRVSTYLSLLEDELGVVLIDRGRRPLEMTIAGELMVGHAREILRAMETARSDLELLSGRKYGAVRLACIPSVAGTCAPALIERFSRAEPSISIQLQEMASSTIASALMERTADLAIMPAAYTERNPDLAAEPLWQEQFYVVVAASHRLAGFETISLSQLASEVIVTAGSAEGGRGLSPEIAPLFDPSVADGLSTRRVASPHTLLALVRRGGVVGVTSPLALELTGSDGVVVRTLADSTARRRVVLARRRGAELPSHIAALHAFILASPPPALTEG